MASGELSLTSNSSQDESPDYQFGGTTLRPSSNSSAGSLGPSLSNNNNPGYKEALLKLDTVQRRCDDMSSQLNYYKEQYMAAMNQLKTDDRTKYSDIVTENVRLKQKNSILDQKLRSWTNNESQSSQNNFKEGFYSDDPYNELGVSSNSTCSGICFKSENLTKELQKCMKRCSDLNKYISNCQLDNTTLRQKNTVLEASLDSEKKEKNLYLERFRQQRELFDKEHKDMKACFDAKVKELLGFKMQSKQVSYELNQILSEKDIVLQENQKMSDDLTLMKKEYEQLEMQKKKDEAKGKAEHKQLQQENNDLMRTLEEMNNKMEKRELLKSRDSAWSKDFSDDKEIEIERLRKSLEKFRIEIERASHETETAKKLRDIAINEREIIVQERDSVKTLCDNLRKERDSKTTDLLSAIIDSENIKKQLDESQKEVEGLKEQMEKKTNFDSRRSIRWSSFDADDVIDIELSYHHDTDIGIILDDSNNRLLVRGVTNTSPAFGKLKINDVILKVNNIDCESMTKRMVLEHIRTCAPRCSLLVTRTKQSKRHLYTVHLNLANSDAHGISLETGFFISKIEQYSPASLEAELDVGDRILSINNKSMEGMNSVKDVMKILDNPRSSSITIIALKNVQDHQFPELVHRRMTNTSAQTESNDSVYKSTKYPSKVTGLFNKIKEKIHITKSAGTDHCGSADEHDALSALDSVISENCSEKSKDKETLTKRSNKRKKDKDASKSVGTWPRAAWPTLSSETQGTGTNTIVERRKERAPLSLFAPIKLDKPSSHNDSGNVTPSVTNTSKTGSSASSTSSKNNPNRNSIPVNLFHPITSNRRSLYSSPPSLDTDPISFTSMPKCGVAGSGASTLGKSSIQRSSQVSSQIRPRINDKYGSGSSRHPTNRFSWNIQESRYNTRGQTAQPQQTGNNQIMELLKRQQQQHHSSPFQPTFNSSSSSNYPSLTQNQQNSPDDISLKSQTSMDSFLSQKGPQSISEYVNSSSSQNAQQINYIKNYQRIIQQQNQNRNVSKYPSDSESLGMDMSLTLSSRQPHQIYLPNILALGPSSHQRRENSSLSIEYIMHPPGQTIGLPSPPNEHDFPSHIPSYNGSGDFNYLPIPVRDVDDFHSGTFPRNNKTSDKRFRIPSTPSVTSKGSGVKNSSGSIDHHGSERGSPMPNVRVEILSHGEPPGRGDLRRVLIDKSDKPLGITFKNKYGAIFVQTVADGSIACKAGLQVGDQLLEVCGINMRSATNEIAANVLRQCGNSITMLVQYNPEKYQATVNNETDPTTINHSGSPTPRNSPRPMMIRGPSSLPPSSTSTLPQSSIKNQKFSDSLEHQSDSSNRNSSGSIYEEEPRLIRIKTDKCKNLGIKLCGGNKVGIFINEIKPGSLGALEGIRTGDQILEYNGEDLRHITAEQAANMLSKLPDEANMLVQNQYQKLMEIQDKPGDSFYIRAGFDRNTDFGNGQLKFEKDDILFVDNTIANGEFGQWRAWKMDSHGNKNLCGLIPSKFKVEDELRQLGDSGDCDTGTTRRGSTSARRSFFRRKKHHRSSSRDSKELASFSNTQLSYFSDSGMLNDEISLASYQLVERLDYKVRRPVFVVGPLAEIISVRLTNDFPNVFQACKWGTVNSEKSAEEGLQKNIFVDYRPKGSKFEVLAVDNIRAVSKNNGHCILDISISAIDRLQRMQIYPIVLLLRFKSAKQIKDLKENTFGTTDKNSAKAAKEMYERALKFESDYKQYISAVIHGNVNINYVSTQIKSAVDDEQSRALWVPITN